MCLVSSRWKLVIVVWQFIQQMRSIFASVKIPCDIVIHCYNNNTFTNNNTFMTIIIII